jgi:hypothetical protein
MKTWNVTIEAESESEALELIKVLKVAFETADKFNEPLHHVYADRKRISKSSIICEEKK